MDSATIVAIIAAIGSTGALLITSLRKRQDTTVEELKLRNVTEENEHRQTKEALEVVKGERNAEQRTSGDLRRQLRLEQNYNVLKDRIIFKLRRVLAQNGLSDPTENDDQGSPWTEALGGDPTNPP